MSRKRLIILLVDLCTSGYSVYLRTSGSLGIVGPPSTYIETKTRIQTGKCTFNMALVKMHLYFKVT